MYKKNLDTPALVVALDIMERNINDMADFCNKIGVNHRPHVKTHKIPAIAQKQIKAGACGITVAKISEAKVMAEGGIKDIFIAYQIVGEKKLESLLKLAKKVPRLSVAIDDFEAAYDLAMIFRKNNMTIDVLLIIESGFKRCGVLPGKPAIDLAKKIIQLKGLRLKGIMGYAGQVCNAHNWKEVKKIGQREGELLVHTANLICSHGIEIETVSCGSTPTSKIAAQVKGVTEVRAGAYIFNDGIEMAIGYAQPKDCALRVISTVISRPTKDRAIIDAGDKVFTPERGIRGMKGFGYIVNRRGLELNIIHEEHGILKLRKQSSLKIGDRLEIIPNHACGAINLFDKLIGLRKDKVEVIWPISGRGKVC